MTKTRVALPVLAAAAALAFLAGCGGGGGESSNDPSTLAPPDASVFIEAIVQPTGSLKTDVEQIASKAAGIEDVGGKIVSEIEKSERDSGEQIDIEKEVEPWLGERVGIAFTGFDGNNFAHYTAAVQTTDAAAAQSFIDHQVKTDGKPDRKGSYEGADFVVQTEDGTTFGMVGEFFVIAKDEKTFKDTVDVSKGGESLAEADRYTTIASEAPEGSLADAYIDIGGLVKESGNNVDPTAKKLLDGLGIEIEEAAALASLVPGSDRVEIDLAADFGEQEAVPPASDLLGTMPAGSVIALAGGEFGKSIGKAIDELDAQGIPGQIPPHEFKSALKRVGIDVDRITGSLGDIAAYAEGTGKSDIAGAVVLTTDNPTEAANTVADVGLLLRANNTPGVTAVTGKASGFSIRSQGLGKKPLVVAAEGKRIAVGYGLPATIRGLTSESGQTLSGNAIYKEAVGALGGSEISGFVNGPAALRLVEGLISPDERAGFMEAKPYLSKIGYVAIGSSTEGGVVKAKLLAGLLK
jgi:hypothetical protein